MAVCPFCRQYIETDAPIYRQIISNHDKDALKSMLAGKVNRIKCHECGEEFYYEHKFQIINAFKNYSIISVPNGFEPVEEIKTALFNILNKNDFRLRYVNEFIYASEKTRIFEYDLDDRVLEIIKYKYVASPKGLGTNAKIILSNTTANALEFAVCDEFDKPVAHHCVAIDSYFNTSRMLDKEIISSPTLDWKRIDLNWAEKYVKENCK